MPHPVVHFEIGCKDSKKTQDFYKSLFDWNITEAGPAAMIDTGGGPTGHISALGHEPHHYTIFYVEVDDVQGLSRSRAKARREDAGSSRSYSHRHLRLAAGPGRQHHRLVETGREVA
jgi:hypothetical protein